MERGPRASSWAILPLALVALAGGLVVVIAMAFGCENARAGDHVCRAAGHPVSWTAVWLLPPLAILVAGYTRARRTFAWTAAASLGAQVVTFVVVAASGV